jgi:hypothetical protein
MGAGQEGSKAAGMMPRDKFEAQPSVQQRTCWPALQPQHWHPPHPAVNTTGPHSGAQFRYTLLPAQSLHPPNLHSTLPHLMRQKPPNRAGATLSAW